MDVSIFSASFQFVGKLMESHKTPTAATALADFDVSYPTS